LTTRPAARIPGRHCAGTGEAIFIPSRCWVATSIVTPDLAGVSPCSFEAAGFSSSCLAHPASNATANVANRSDCARQNFMLIFKSVVLSPAGREFLNDGRQRIRGLLQRILEEENYAVVPAANGVEGLELAKTTLPDLVLLDLNLPMQNGWDTFKQLNVENPSLAVIVITARPNQIFPALAAGASALMEKPLDLAKLLRTIRDLLAEPIEARLARMAGQRAEFHYLPPKGREPANRGEEKHSA